VGDSHTQRYKKAFHVGDAGNSREAWGSYPTKLSATHNSAPVRAPCPMRKPMFTQKAASRPVVTRHSKKCRGAGGREISGSRNTTICTSGTDGAFPQTASASSNNAGALRIEKPPSRSGSAAFASPDLPSQRESQALWISGPQ
jgi:hypothetical protein